MDELSLPFDVVVVGAASTGWASPATPRCAALRSPEQDDICSGVSAWSGLVHGGLRYLEHRDFALVRESPEREPVPLARTWSSRCGC